METEDVVTLRLEICQILKKAGLNSIEIGNIINDLYTAGWSRGYEAAKNVWEKR